MLDNPLSVILNLLVLFLGVWVALAVSLNLRDARRRKRLQQVQRQARVLETMPVEQVIRLAKWKRLQQARQRVEVSETIPVEQVMRLAEWKMQQWMSEKE